jgi:hypothetical protein
MPGAHAAGESAPGAPAPGGLKGLRPQGNRMHSARHVPLHPLTPTLVRGTEAPGSGIGLGASAT